VPREQNGLEKHNGDQSARRVQAGKPGSKELNGSSTFVHAFWQSGYAHPLVPGLRELRGAPQPAVCYHCASGVSGILMHDAPHGIYWC